MSHPLRRDNTTSVAHNVNHIDLAAIPRINIGARSANAPLTQSYDQGPDLRLVIELVFGRTIMLNGYSCNWQPQKSG